VINGAISDQTSTKEDANNGKNDCSLPHATAKPTSNMQRFHHRNKCVAAYLSTLPLELQIKLLMPELEVIT
jgi:hypothetical protein